MGTKVKIIKKPGADLRRQAKDSAPEAPQKSATRIISPQGCGVNIPRFDPDGIPIVDGFLRSCRDGVVELVFNCYFCGKQHHHGGLGLQPGALSYRSSHCTVWSHNFGILIRGWTSGKCR